MKRHALTELFETLTERSFTKVGLTSPELPRYVAGILEEFTHIDRLYKIRDAQGCRIEDIGEMLLEGDLRHRGQSLEREREVRRHVGDFTLFFTGMFPESIKSRRSWLRVDRYLDWIEAGRESYRMVAGFNDGPWALEAPLYGLLADHFDFMVVGLNFVRDELVQLHDERFLISREILKN